jgi:hypothetical protein
MSSLNQWQEKGKPPPAEAASTPQPPSPHGFTKASSPANAFNFLAGSSTPNQSMLEPTKPATDDGWAEVWGTSKKKKKKGKPTSEEVAKAEEPRPLALDSEEIGPGSEQTPVLGPFSDSGYASAKHGPLKHAQNLAVEDATQCPDDMPSEPPLGEETTPVSHALPDCKPNSEDLDRGDTRTVYSDASSLPALKSENYISELAEDLLSKIYSDDLDSQSIERVSERLPDLLKAFALKLGFGAQTQMHRDIMFFVHKHRR